MKGVRVIWFHRSAKQFTLTPLIVIPLSTSVNRTPRGSEMPIKRGKIELAQGAIAPTQRGLWHLAAEKLTEAATGISEMQVATDRFQFEAGWTKVVDSLEVCWSRFFDEGKETFSNFEPWAANINVRRRADPLLKYLIFARHKSQHGRIALVWEETRISIAVGYGAPIRDLKFYADGTFEVDTPQQDEDTAPPRMVMQPSRAILPELFNKKLKQTLLPPTDHFGAPLQDSSPVAVAVVGVKFYDSILRDAFTKFAGTPQSPRAG